MGLGIGDDFTASPHLNAPAAGAIGLHNAGPAINNGAGRKIRALDMFHQAININIRVINQRQTAIDDLGEIMGRYVGGHTHSNTAGAIHQQVRHL